MSLISFLLFLLLGIFDNSVHINCVGLPKKNIDYKFLSTEIINKTPETLDANVKLTRIARGSYGISGNVTVLKGVVDDSLKFELDIYKSPRNDGDYQRTPYRVSTSAYKFMNEQYKNFVMETVKDCSNAPVFEGTYNTPIKEGTTFTFDKCVFKQTDSTPASIQPGFYKFVARGHKEPEFDVTFEIIAEIFNS